VTYVDIENLDDYKKPYIYYQTFRINAMTTIKTLRETACQFWEIQDKPEEYVFRYIDDSKELMKIPNQGFEEYVDKFLKSKNGIKKAKFVLNKHKENYSKLVLILEEFDDDIRASEDFLEKKNSKATVFKSFECSEVTRKFLQRFVGLSSHMNNEFNKIYYDSLENKNKKEEKKEATSVITLAWKFISELSFLLFFILTVLCLFFMKNTSTTYLMSSTMQSLFAGSNKASLTELEFKQDLLQRFQLLFYSDKQKYKEIIPINTLRISIVKYYLPVSIKPNKCHAQI
jgi:hypothetical protein